MASADISSEDDDYGSRRRSRRGRRLPDPPSPRSSRRGILRTAASDNVVVDRVDRIATSLEDTNRNLRRMDRVLGEYSEVSEEQGTEIDRLRGRLARSAMRLQEERVRRTGPARGSTMRPSELDMASSGETRRYRPTSPLRNYESNVPRRRTGSTVRFLDGGDDDIHEVHQTVRDLTSDQLRMGEDLEREIDRRTRMEQETQRNLREMSDSLRRSSTSESASERVDRRLQQIQDDMKSQQRQLARRQEETASMSDRLRDASRRADMAAESDRIMRERLADMESRKSQVESELEETKRRLNQSEGGREALMNQIEDLRGQLGHAERERVKMRDSLSMAESERTRRRQEQEELANSRQRREAYQLDPEKEGLLDEIRHLKSQVNGTRGTARQTVISEQAETERRRLEDEVRELRAQLSRSSGISVVEELKQTLDRSERQRQQLSDHLESLSKDLEKSDNKQARLMSQLKETTEQLQDSEHQRESLAVQLEDANKRLREVTRESDRYAEDLRSTRQGKEESDRQTEEIKNKAQEAVRQWKLKCRKLEREVDRQKHGASQMQERNEQLVKENEAMRQQAANSVHQIESLRREMDDTLRIRAEQAEQLKLRDVEVNELKGRNMDLDRELRETRQFMDKLDNELQTQTARSSALADDKRKLEEEVSLMKASYQRAHEETMHLQKDIKDLSTQRLELSSQLAEERTQRKALQKAHGELEERAQRSQEEAGTLARQLDKEQKTHVKEVSDLQTELQAIKSRESRKEQDLIRRAKRERAELDAEIQTLKVGLEEERAAAKLLKRQLENAQKDYNTAKEESDRLEELSSRLQKKYQRAKEDIQEKEHLVAEEGDAVKQLEDRLSSVRDKLTSQEEGQEILLRQVGREIDTLVDIATADSEVKFQALSSSKGLHSDPQRWLADITSKLQWLKEEVRLREDRERRLRGEIQKNNDKVKEVIRSTEVDRDYYTTEITKQSKLLDQMTNERQDLLDRTQEKNDIVRHLEGRVSELTHRLEETLRQTPGPPDRPMAAQLEDLQESQKQRDRIQERYAMYKEKLGSLQSELKGARKAAFEHKQAELDASLRSARLASMSPTASPIPRRGRVRVSESPPTLLRASSYRSRSPVLYSRARSPTRSPRSRSPIRSRSRSPEPAGNKKPLTDSLLSQNRTSSPVEVLHNNGR
ncbi:centrosomal protein of 128 kDa-like isoform X3 [Branchiostoma floridae]|uniref:Centrosomal protein of 128 kDa-like isoform X3 n=1 Tax=Branchiostoma floridae TaxID=7739 RepID=A0A9J7KQ03_BRAFL|nr:centrosomal protein of 128 kDa-like isoform X3 [Branchiostoma floridae]